MADRNWLLHGVAALERFDYIGGQVITRIGQPEETTLAEAVEVVFAFHFEKYIEKDGFSGSGNLFVPKAILARVGGFRADISEEHRLVPPGRMRWGTG